MKVMQKGLTPDGVKIQIEDWSEDYSCFGYADNIAAYPKTPSGYSYRAECQFENCDKAIEAFENLKSGSKTLDNFNFTSKKSGFDIPFRDFRFNY